MRPISFLPARSCTTVLPIRYWASISVSAGNSGRRSGRRTARCCGGTPPSAALAVTSVTISSVDRFLFDLFCEPVLAPPPPLIRTIDHGGCQHDDEADVDDEPKITA